MKRFFILLLFLIIINNSYGELIPKRLLCEWTSNPLKVTVPYPEFYWEVEEQSAYQVVVGISESSLNQPENALWNSGQIASLLPIVEYGGRPPLENGTTYYWKVRVWSLQGTAGQWSSIQRFTIHSGPMPHIFPTVRTFLNFGKDPKYIADKIDYTFRNSAKQYSENIIATNYSLICTMVIPSSKADLLVQYCVQRGLTNEGILEEMFLHFAENAEVTLHVGAERADNPREKRLIKGWDSRNDRDGNGQVDENQ